MSSLQLNLGSNQSSPSRYPWIGSAPFRVPINIHADVLLNSFLGEREKF